MRDGLHTQYKSSTKAKACKRRSLNNQEQVNTKPGNLKPTESTGMAPEVPDPAIVSSSSTTTSNPSDSSPFEPLPFPILEVSIPTPIDLVDASNTWSSETATTDLDLEPLPIYKGMDFDANLSQFSIVSDDEDFKASIDELVRYGISASELCNELLGL